MDVALLAALIVVLGAVGGLLLWRRRTRPWRAGSKAARRESRSRELPPDPPLPEGLLAGLDRVDWSAVAHAYGPADDVPGLLRSLVSPYPERREETKFALYGNLWHQGTVYEATGAAVPFLVELAGASSTAERAWILSYLSDLACGSSYLDVHQHLSVFGEMLRQEDDFEERLQRELGWVASAHWAVADGCPACGTCSCCWQDMARGQRGPGAADDRCRPIPSGSELFRYLRNRGLPCEPPKTNARSAA